MVRAARSARTPLEIRGGGTRGGLGRPVQAGSLLSTRALSGIVFHEPAELVIRARAGTPMAEIEAALDAHNQFLPFEPMDHRALYGAQGEPRSARWLPATFPAPAASSAARRATRSSACVSSTESEKPIHKIPAAAS